jgi:hypothetical protein
MARELSCKKPHEHHLHLCSLKTHLPENELALLRKNPKYVCAICGGRVDRGLNLCAPKRIRT